MLIFGSFTKKTIKSYNFICNSHKKVNKILLSDKLD